MNYYKRHLGDYSKKAGRLSMLQHGSYTLLIDACYDRERFPTLDEAIEWTWASTTEEVEAVRFVLGKFFTLENGVYIQKRIEEEISDYHGKSATNKRIADEREAKRRENSTLRAQFVDGSPPNHKPLTINQENKDSCPQPSATNGLPECPHQEILALFADKLPALTQPRTWDGSRASNLKARWRWLLTSTKPNGQPYATTAEEALGFFGRMFAYVGESDFLMGRAGKWCCDLPWLVKAENFSKVIEGKYENRTEEAA